MTEGFRQYVQDALYLAAIPAIRFDPNMKAVFDWLKAKVKAGTVALVAVMRKMIILQRCLTADTVASL